jgi:hypothetical protein
LLQLQLIDEALNAVTLTVSVSVEVGLAPFVVRGWDDGADPAPPQGLADFTAAVSL